MDEQVVQAGRREVVAQRFERHTSVARGQLQLLEAQRAISRCPRRNVCLTHQGRIVTGVEALAATATEKPRVFYEIDVTGGIFTPPADSIYGEMFTLAGGDPISGDPNYSISLEELVAADPEVILLGDGAVRRDRRAVKAREGWGGMTAVKDGRIVAVDDIVITRPGPRLAEGLRALIAAIHPELA